MEKPTHPIPIAKPELDEAEVAAVSEVIRGGWIMQGNRVTAFEQAFAQYAGAPYAIAVSSGTAALHLALYAGGCGPGKSVICPSYSFIATANVIRHCGAEPIFVDIEAKTYNIDANLLAKVCRSDTYAILLVHQVGLPAALDEVLAFAKERNLVVIEDAACAIGAYYHGEPIGKPHSLAACFSFHPRKIITTGDGGMITTADAEFAARVRRLRQHGLDTGGENYREVGFNYRLTDLQAALGIEQLKKLPAMLARRHAQVDHYNRAFMGHKWLSVPVEQDNTKGNFQAYQLRLHPTAPITQTELLSELKKSGISAQPGIRPIHLEPIYGGISNSLPETERAAKEVIMLPLYHALTDEEQDYIIETLLRLVKGEA